MENSRQTPNPTQGQLSVCHIIPHTHWDRAWYQSFESYRFRWIPTLDAILETLQKKPAFKYFTLDGQTALLEDYLEIRPEKKPLIERLIRQGRLVVGPWYTLPDLFLSGGEAVIRNLQIGLGSVSKPMRMGYVPDPFGHFAQLPQILVQMGLQGFFFMRGMPKALLEEKGTQFYWQAPDGSQILAWNLLHGYLGASALGYDAEWGRHDLKTPTLKNALSRLKQLTEDLKKHEGGPFLLPNGCDHMPIQPELPKLLAQLHEATLSKRALLQISTFEKAYKALEKNQAKQLSQKRKKPYTGDLVSAGIHPILSSVYSTRTYLKLKNDIALNELLWNTEAFLVTLGVYDSLLETFLTRAWKIFLHTQAHDDICGCSIDSVHQENEVQYQKIMDLCAAIRTKALEAVLKEKSTPKAQETGFRKTALIVWNPSPEALKRWVEFSALLPTKGGEFDGLPESFPIWAYTFDQTQNESVVRSPVPLQITEDLPHAVRSAFIETTWGRKIQGLLEVNVPAWSYQVIHLEECSNVSMPKLKTKVSTEPQAPEVYFEWDADQGDVYSGSPVVHSEIRSVLLPSGIHQIIHPTQGPLPIEVRWIRHEEKYELQIKYNNTLKNGRLRLMVPTRATHFTVEHPLREARFEFQAKKQYFPQTQTYPGELPYPTQFMASYAVLSDGITLATQGLHEVEGILGNPSVFALTLHRSVGMLSVARGSIRSCQAGPSIETPEAQALRPHHFKIDFGQSHSVKPRPESNPYRYCVLEIPYLTDESGAREWPKQLNTQKLFNINNSSIIATSVRPVCNEKPRHSAQFQIFTLRLCNLSAHTETGQLEINLLHCVIRRVIKSELRHEGKLPKLAPKKRRNKRQAIPYELHLNGHEVATFTVEIEVL